METIQTNLYQLTNKLYLKFNKMRKSLDIVDMQYMPTCRENKISFEISFNIRSREEYLHSYLRCCRVMKQLDFGKYKICQSGFTMWEKDGCDVAVSLTDWEGMPSSYPSIEKQAITVWEKV